MISNQPSKQKGCDANELRFALTPGERTLLMVIAARSALVWASVIALGWFVIWWLVPNDEEAYWGVVLGLGIFVFVLVRTRKAMLNRTEMMWDETARRHGLDALYSNQQPKI